MKYNNYRGIYTWVGIADYQCETCNEIVSEDKRMMHIGKHMKDETRIRLCPHCGSILYIKKDDTGICLICNRV
jgi:predicted  nucleic acid-binding Zn-ribbon protein